MRVLFTSPPAKAHLYAQVPLAWALRTAGHEVVMANRPNMAAEITRTGLTAVPVGPAFDPSAYIPRDGEAEKPSRATAPWASWDQDLEFAELRPERLTHDYMQAVHAAWTVMFQGVSPLPLIDDLVGFARWWRPDLVIWDTMAFAAPVAARVCGAAHARALFGLDLIAHMRSTYLHEQARRPRQLRDDPLEDWLEPILAQYGHSFDEEMVVGQWTIDPLLPSMRLPVRHPYMSVRYVPYNGQAVVPDLLRKPPAGRRVCLTLGLTAREVLNADRVPVDTVLQAVAGLDAEVIATLNADQLATISRVPDNVRTIDFVPMNELLPSCSAVIHQGGFGTLQTAVAHGVPQVILPPRAGDWDSMVWARKVEESGAGVCVPSTERVTAQELRGTLDAVLEQPSFRRAAAGLRAEMLGTPSPLDIVPLIEERVAAHRTDAR
ncbi:activator-dependent family glycosyltransferase [Streptomyces bugieae]|uniref:Activator-dependent family glycosyltransferase n=1 Tax=Streptomyces bugieae TaxID=3098223 RepID=A0ABU7NRZ6_9ACTN|nr:activator-dependent family glycosyltransferase [Streptomyces sp. DSM 41528]